MTLNSQRPSSQAHLGARPEPTESVDFDAPYPAYSLQKALRMSIGNQDELALTSALIMLEKTGSHLSACEVGHRHLRAQPRAADCLPSRLRVLEPSATQPI